MVSNSSPLSKENMDFLLNNIKKVDPINPDYFKKYDVKKGLRNNDGTGVMAGLTRICSVDGYHILDGEKIR